ncbi:MAG: hypothetical protein R3Y50_10675 [Rikenellaceae bacterium]
MYIDSYSGEGIEIGYEKNKATFGSRLAFKGKITEAENVTIFKSME